MMQFGCEGKLNRIKKWMTNTRHMKVYDVKADPYQLMPPKIRSTGRFG